MIKDHREHTIREFKQFLAEHRLKIRVTLTNDGKYKADVPSARLWESGGADEYVDVSTSNLAQTRYETADGAMLALAIGTRLRTMLIGGYGNLVAIPNFYPDLSKYSELD